MGKRRKWDRKEERKVEGKREEGKSTETEEEGKGKGGGRKGGKGRGREGIGGRERQEEEGVNRDTFWMPWELLQPTPFINLRPPRQRTADQRISCCESLIFYVSEKETCKTDWSSWSGGGVGAAAKPRGWGGRRSEGVHALRSERPGRRQHDVTAVARPAPLIWVPQYRTNCPLPLPLPRGRNSLVAYLLLRLPGRRRRSALSPSLLLSGIAHLC